MASRVLIEITLAKYVQYYWIKKLWVQFHHMAVHTPEKRTNKLKVQTPNTLWRSGKNFDKQNMHPFIIQRKLLYNQLVTWNKNMETKPITVHIWYYFITVASLKIMVPIHHHYQNTPTHRRNQPDFDFSQKLIFWNRKESWS